MKSTPAFFSKDNLPRLCMIAVTAVLITITGILYRQSFLRILPLYISLFVGALQSRANRYASLLGGCNSILYTLVYWYLGLYASAGYALFFSCPVQIATFVRWSRNKYGSSTRFRRMNGKQRVLVAAGFLLCFAVLYVVLKLAGSSHQLLDNLSSLLGILISILTMLAFIEYTWLMLPSGIISICLNIATMAEHPEQITYVIFSLYSIICVTQQFFRVRKLYQDQQQSPEPQEA
ncbi:MAG: nicotinamide mononucleotide transporter [Clostridia bacterium]|nr:nicotinamide mononucleotide transporter [Clostridia bacterium]